MVAVPVNRLKTTKPATLRAGPVVPLRVRVVAADGKPIPDALVTLVDGQLTLDRSFVWGYNNATWENMVRARTAADGVANFPALSIGGATVLVQAPGFARHRVAWRDGEKELKCELPKEAVLMGLALDAAGKPLKESYVHLMSGGDEISTGIDQDDKGRFRITELPAGTWSVTLRTSDGMSFLHRATVTLKAGETKECEIKMKEE